MIYELARTEDLKAVYNVVQLNYDRRKFVPKMNSENGVVSKQTKFTYHQDGNLLRAEYCVGEWEDRTFRTMQGASGD